MTGPTQNDFLDRIQERVALARIQEELVMEGIAELRAAIEDMQRVADRPIELLDLYYDRIAPVLWR